jgi:hypothetical protein
MKKNDLALVATVFGATLILWGWFLFVVNPELGVRDTGATPKATQEVAPPKPVAPWYPSDFEELTSNVAYKSLGIGNMDCGYSSAHSCFQIYVVTRVDCKLFVNVNHLKDGVVVDDSIDSATVRAGEIAILSFASFKTVKYSGTGRVKFTDVKCY